MDSSGKQKSLYVFDNALGACVVVLGGAWLSARKHTVQGCAVVCQSVLRRSRFGLVRVASA